MSGPTAVALSTILSIRVAPAGVGTETLIDAELL